VVLFLGAGLSGGKELRSTCVRAGGPGCMQSCSSWFVSQSVEVLLHMCVHIHLSREGIAIFVVPLLANETETLPSRLLFQPFPPPPLFNMTALSAVSERGNCRTRKQVCTAQCKFSSGNAVSPLPTTSHVLVWGMNGRHTDSPCSRRNVSVLGDSYSVTLQE